MEYVVYKESKTSLNPSSIHSNNNQTITIHSKVTQMSQQLVWLITGANSGFGTEFVHQILARGDKVIATGRNPDKLAVLSNTEAHLLKLDVTSPLEELTSHRKRSSQCLRKNRRVG